MSTQVGASRSVGTETMEFHEGLGLLGPCRGCVGGSLGYCCGGGCRLTCFPERRGTLTMLRDAGLNFDAKGWHVKRYHLCGSQPVCRVRRHAVEKASRRWRGGRRDDSAEHAVKF